MVRGVSGDKTGPLSISISYDDDIAVQRPHRQIQILSTGIQGMKQRSPAESFLLFEQSYEMEIANFVSNVAVTRLPQDENGTPLPGTRRPLMTVDFRDGLFLERVVFVEHPELLLYRVQTLRVEILVMGWNWDEDFLTEFARKARRIQEDGSLFEEMKRAEEATWKKINSRH